MAKNSKEKEREKAEKKSKNSTPSEPVLNPEIKYTMYAIGAFLVAFFFILAAWGNAGPSGNVLYTAFRNLFGVGYVLVPLMAIVLGISFLRSHRPNIGITHTISVVVFLLAALGIIDIVSTAHSGGAVGAIVAFPLVKLFDHLFSFIIFFALLVAALMVLFDTKPSVSSFRARLLRLFGKKVAEEKDGLEKEPTIVTGEEDAPKESMKEKVMKSMGKEKEDKEEELSIKQKRFTSRGYTPPSLDLLKRDSGKPNVGDIKANSNIIKRTLSNFGIEVEMDEITIGPTVTRYALKPAEGVKLSRIVGLQSDLGLALAAHPIRIEAPIPGKSLVGIEVPNKVKSTVGLASLLADERFMHAAKPLMVAMGRGLSGKATFSNLAKMPHALIAGTTGSGKSVTIHALITSLLYRNGPEDLRFIMVDPKRVELTLYNKIPHLLTPVITDPKKAILSLKWAAKEMERRYNVLESHSVRDVESYHNNIFKTSKKDENSPESMPYIVIIIDELADIMQAYPRELESAIVRLAQMSRAVGIHLILSTQRPSVNVITGLIKANVPTRVALQVSSQIDSRTILDEGGAEKLLGAGDMLYATGEMSQPERIQSAFITEDEVKSVVKYLADAYKDEIQNDINLTASNIGADKSIFDSQIGDDDDAGDDLYEDARQIVIEAGKASTSYLQRKLGVGYARAAKLIDILEERGVVGPGSGSKPREVLEKSVSEEMQSYEA